MEYDRRLRSTAILLRRVFRTEAKGKFFGRSICVDLCHQASFAQFVLLEERT